MRIKPLVRHRLQFTVPCLVGCVLLGSCAPRLVWVKPGATDADFPVTKGQCLAAAYSQVPAAMSVMTLGSGYQAPMFTNCTGFGNFANCTTTGGYYTPPAQVPYDANAGVRNQVFKGCMYNEGWSLQQPTSNASVPAPANPAADWQLRRFCASVNYADPDCSVFRH